MITAIAALIAYSMPWSAALDRKQLGEGVVSIVQFQEFLKPSTARVGENTLKAKGDWKCSTAPAKVLLSASPSLRQGSTTKVLIWRPPGDTVPEEVYVNRSTHYLMVSCEQAGPGFKITNGSKEYRTSLVLKPAEAEDESALLLLPTRAKQLPKGLEGADLVTAAILDCLDPDEEISYRIVARILCTTHPDWIEKQDQPRPGLPPGPTRVCPDGPLVDRIRAHLAKARTPYEKSKVLELMVRWHIKGSIKPYMMALRQLLRDPHAYSEEEDRQYLWGLIRDIGAQAVEFDGFYQELEDDAINDLLGASNPVLAIYWMDHCGQIPNSEQMARFATLLNWDNKDVQYKVAESLANWLHEPTHAPKLYGSVGDHEIPYPDLTEAVAYWKKRFGIDEARLFAACPAVPGDIDIAGNSLPSSRGRSHPCDPVAAFSSLLSASRT